VVGLVLVDVGGRPEGSESRPPAAKGGQIVAESAVLFRKRTILN